MPPTDVVELLRSLVAVPSVNPMGGSASGPNFFEHHVTDFLEEHVRRLGLEFVRQRVADKRENLLVRLPGDDRTVLWEVHQDTVPVTGMTIDPFAGEVRDGRVYGRGSCDVKGGMAAMLTAIEQMSHDQRRDKPTIVLACTVNEEHGYTGATALTRLWRESSDFFPRPPVAAIVAEPTRLDVVVAHKGAVRWRCVTHGTAAHSSQPQLGRNAIYGMAGVLQKLEEYASTDLANRGAHPLCGPPTLSVGRISGGISVNTVPAECSIEIDRRLIPGESPEVAAAEVAEHLRTHCSESIRLTHEEPFLVGYPLADEGNHELADGLSRHATEFGGGRVIGVPYGTDAAVIAASGVPAVVFGPGSIDQAHTADEWVEIDQLEKAVNVLVRYGRSGDVAVSK